ncbi:MAG TPA: extracellular solute-binding protein [Clostridia bacterium]|nr:extracellular solute-binding protein [Clostridia bacterium]
MKRYIKPITLFLCIIILAFLVIGTRTFLMGSDKSVRPHDDNEKQNSRWTGIITLWDIPYVDTGIGSNSIWLNTRIEEFERGHPGIFIDVRRMTPQRAEMYFTGNVDKAILPDIISIPPYGNLFPYSILQELDTLFNEDEKKRIIPLAKKFMHENNITGAIPYMMGTYALYTNMDMLEERELVLEEADMDYTALNRIIEGLPHIKKDRKKEIYYYGFGTYSSPYSNPIISMIYSEVDNLEADMGYRYVYDWVRRQDTIPEGMGDMSSTAAIELFASQGRIGAFLGSTRVLYRNRALISQGKGFEMGVYPLPMEGKEGLFQDQVAAYGIIKKDNEEKLNNCVAFLRTLLSQESQADLKRIGMFPVVIDAEHIYEDDPEMSKLEEHISNFRFSPRDEFWIKNQNKLLNVLPGIPDKENPEDLSD